jgi:hypothetical protein
MNVPSFIGLSAALLLTWLGATYFHEIPHGRYPKQGPLTSTSPVTESGETPENLLANISDNKESN